MDTADECTRADKSCEGPDLHETLKNDRERKDQKSDNRQGDRFSSIVKKNIKHNKKNAIPDDKKFSKVSILLYLGPKTVKYGPNPGQIFSGEVHKVDKSRGVAAKISTDTSKIDGNQVMKEISKKNS